MSLFISFSNRIFQSWSESWPSYDMTKQNLFLPFFPIFITPSYSTLINALNINNILSNRERERERDVNKVLQLLEGVQIVRINKCFEFTRNLLWSHPYGLFLSLLHLHSPPTDHSHCQRERERRCCWAIYLGRFSKTQQLRQYMSYTSGFVRLDKQTILNREPNSLI